MGGDKSTSKKPANSYSLLQKVMSEVEKSKKPNQDTSSPKNQVTTSSSRSSNLPKVISNKNPEKSPQVEKESTSDKNTDPNLPDHTYGDYYCRICDSHMNCHAMWDAHVAGKRHLKNVRSGEHESKYEDLNVESSVMREIKNVKDAIIGLTYIHEIRRKEIGPPPLYTCFLCQGTCATVPMVIEHVISMKHRMNYIKENAPDKYELLGATNLKKELLEPIVEDLAYEMEQKNGRGSVKVKQEKSKSTSFKKRAYDSDDDDVPKKLPKSKKDLSPQDSLRRRTLKSRSPLKEHYFYYHNSDLSPERSSRRGTATSRTPPREHYSYSHYSDSSPERSARRSTVTSRTPPKERYSHSHKFDLSPERSSRRGTVTSKTPPKERYSYSHSQKSEKATHYLEDNSLSADIELQKSDSSSQLLKKFLQEIYALPTELFLKVVLLRLENMKVSGLDELFLLSEVKNRAELVTWNNTPPYMKEVLKQQRSQNLKSNSQLSVPPVTPQLQASQFKYIQDVFNQVKGSADSSSSVSQNMTPQQTFYQNATSCQNSLHETFNSAYPNRTTSSSRINYSYYNSPYSASANIPGLTLIEEKRDISSSDSNCQPDYPGPSSSKYPSYGY